MNISFNPNIQAIYGTNKTTNTKKSPLAPLAADVVQFTGKKEKPLPINIQQGVEFGEKVIKSVQDGTYSLETLASFVHENIQDIEVYPAEELKRVAPDWYNYEAMNFSHLSEDFTYDMKQIYFKIRKNADENERLLSIMGSAHEYTHAAQDMNDKKRLEFLKTISKNDPISAQVFVSTAENMFTFFDNELQAYSCMGAIKKSHPTEHDMSYGQILPKEANVDKNDIFASLGIKDEKDFKKLVNASFDTVFAEVLPAIQKQLPPETFNKLPNLNKPERLKGMLRNYLSMKANAEEEAYTTEAILAHKITGKDNLSTDIFPIYYKMLSEAF